METMNSREMAAVYNLDRDRMETLLAEIQSPVISIAGELRYDPADVAARLAQRDKELLTVAIKALASEVPNYGVAQRIISEAADGMFKTGLEEAESLSPLLNSARRGLSSHLDSYALVASRVAIRNARTPDDEVSAQWALLRELDNLRQTVLLMLAHNTGERNDNE